jgi:hypothetical protein
MLVTIFNCLDYVQQLRWRHCPFWLKPETGAISGEPNYQSPGIDSRSYAASHRKDANVALKFMLTRKAIQNLHFEYASPFWIWLAEDKD